MYLVIHWPISYNFNVLGQAEAISKEIHEAALFRNYEAKIHCLKEENKFFSIRDVKCGVFVCSTTGRPRCFKTKLQTWFCSVYVRYNVLVHYIADVI